MKLVHHFLLLLVLLLFIAWAEASNLDWIVYQAAKDYRADYQFNDECYLDGQRVTLAELIYGLWVAEWWFREWSAGRRTNNPWSLHKRMWIKPLKWTEYIDWSKQRPVYHTMYDWLYEKAYLIVKRYGCNFWYKSAFAYTSWPKANPNSFTNWTKITKRQNALNWLGNAKRWVEQYKERNWTSVPATESVDTTTDLPAVTEPIQEWCRRIATAKEWERVQVDKHNLSWFLSVIREWIVWPNEKAMIFICDN